MADDVTLPGAGSVIATDDVGGRQFQLNKLDGGGNGVSVPIIAGPQASSAALPVVGPTDEFATISVDVTRPADTTTYAVNDAIADSTSSTNAFTIPDAVKASGGSGIITDIMMISSADPATSLQCEILFFDSGITTPVDNAAFAISDVDAKKFVGIVPLVLQDVGNNDVGHAQGVNMGFTCAGSANLRFCVRAKNAYAPANGEVFTFRFKIQRMT